MTRIRPAKSVEAGFGQGRLRIARAYLAAAQAEVMLLEAGDIGNPAMSQIVNATIAFADALTVAEAGTVNRRDHAALPQVLRQALGDRLPKARQTDLQRILAEKSEVQYGDQISSAADAQSLLARLEAFAAWAELELRRRG